MTRKQGFLFGQLKIWKNILSLHFHKTPFRVFLSFNIIDCQRAKRSHTYWLRTTYATSGWERESLFGCFRYLSPVFVCVGLSVFNVRKQRGRCGATHFYALVGRARNLRLQNRYQKFTFHHSEKLCAERNQA